jgi:integrase
MMNEAERQKLIKNNPCDEVKKMSVEEEERKILTVEEARKLFPANWAAVWDTKVSYLANKLAACTGMRIGELRGEHIFDDYIFVRGQYTNNGYVPHTKTKHNRNTLLRMSNVADSKVQSVTGHRSMRMTDHYTHFDTRQFTEIRDVQVELLAFKQPEKTRAKRNKGTQVKKAAAKKKATA